jgi:hypothetical protein
MEPPAVHIDLGVGVARVVAGGDRRIREEAASGVVSASAQKIGIRLSLVAALRSQVWLAPAGPGSSHGPAL